MEKDSKQQEKKAYASPSVNEQGVVARVFLMAAAAGALAALGATMLATNSNAVAAGDDYYSTAMLPQIEEVIEADADSLPIDFDQDV
ncbi:MAG: hypothetical protein Q4A17_09085 [Thermoguttaceae bacterium]|nr:hypothetical protein [Thermoguttaceae bacterium]